MPDCIFCKIIAGSAPASELYRDERVIAFLDIRPVNAGHLLVVPLRHADGLNDLDEEDAAAMMRAGKRLAAALQKSGIPCDGVNLHLADGAAAGQEVFHAHLHVIPRVRGDGSGFRFGTAVRAHPPSREELDFTAGLITTHLDGQV